MRNPTYRYNPETCLYERTKLSGLDALWYVIGLSFTACLMMAAMLILHDFFVDSEKEETLQKENATLKKHHIILTKQVEEVEATLASLQKKDIQLHHKFFSPGVEAVNTAQPTAKQEHLLLADSKEVMNVINDLDEKSQDLIKQSTRINNAIAEHFTVNKPDPSFIASIPTRSPIQQISPDNLMSGFGMQVNPFHKGLYDHDGIDIAVPRGTPVIATASGIVVRAHYTTLEAGYGNFIEIDHGHGFMSRYAHVDDINVRIGEKIKKGAVIALTGNTGASVAPHLHYEIIRNGKHVNPVLYIMEGINAMQYNALKLASENQNQSLD
jgi:murein DD-endopeptidase MepM/ murein hydrolase activator NlpD